MRMLRSILYATALAMLPAMYTGLCEGAAPSVSMLNLPIASAATTADTQGNIFFTGVPGVGILPVTPGAPQMQPGGGTCQEELYPIGLQSFPCSDAFVAKVRADTGAVVYATYLGGDTNDAGTGIAVDAAGNVYVTGATGGGFPTTSHAAVRTGNYGVFAAKLSPDGSHFLYSTYLPFTVPASRITYPGTGVPPPPAIAVDSQGHAYITGQSAEGHAFVVKLSKDGSAMVYRTVLRGSSGLDAGTAIAVDAAGNVYVTGMTTSPDFHTSAGPSRRGWRGRRTLLLPRSTRPALSCLPRISAALDPTRVSPCRSIRPDPLI